MIVCIRCSKEFPAEVFISSRGKALKMCPECRAQAKETRSKYRRENTRVCVKCKEAPPNRYEDNGKIVAELTYYRGEMICERCLIEADRPLKVEDFVYQSTDAFEEADNTDHGTWSKSDHEKLNTPIQTQRRYRK